MANLTRILNNQIYNQTIIASQKIQPGSITGTLFASNVTVPGDFLITGNLFVLGSSQTTTIASTNTYVNDPLVVLNNGFAGTNTYDEGLVFNRGSADNKAFIWSETFKEFRLITTAEGGTTYGNITSQLGLANLSVGKFVATGPATFANISTSGNISASSLNVTGNVLASTVLASLLTADDLTVGNVAAGFIGNTGTIYTGASINLSGNVLASAMIGASLTVSGNVLASTVLGQLVTADDATFGNVVAGFIGNTGTAFTGATINLSGNVLAGLAQFAAINNTPIGNATASTGAFTTLSAANNLWANASIATTTQGTGAIVVPNGGISVAGAANIAGTATIGGATQLNSTLGVGGITTFTNTTNATSPLNGAVIIQGGAGITQDLWVGGNIYASNIFGTSQQIITVKDPLLYLDAANTYPYNYDIGFYSNFVGPNSIDNTGNVYQHTSLLRDNADNTWKFVSNIRGEPTAGSLPINSDTIYDPVRAGNLVLVRTDDSTSATTGALQVGGGAGIAGNIFHTGTRLETSASNYIFASTPTTVDAFKAATDLEIGATSGTLTINNPTVVGTQTTQALYNTVTDTLNFARAANITMGHTSGITTLQGAANIQAVTTSTNADTGALKVQGGVGVRGNLNIAGGNTGIAYSGRGALTVGLDVAGGTLYPENLAQFTSNANSYSRISIQNISTQQNATSEFIAVTNNGSNTSGYITTGITGVNFNYIAASSVVRPFDGYTITTGNLVLSSTKDIILAPNGQTQVGVRASATWANVGIQYASPASSSTTGALTTVGGVGVGTNLYVGLGATINSTNGIEGFTVKSNKVGNVAIFANVQGSGLSTTESVIIGGGNLTLQPGAVLKVGGSTSMMVPVGPTAARPSSQGGNDVAGMLRFNSTTNTLEFYDGTAWNVAGSVFTVISDRQFSGNTAGGFGNVDGTNTTFTLQASATTSSTIISINGVLQFPTLAYSVSGTTLTFTEPPAPDDVIDARVLTTTTTVSTITNGNGINQLITSDQGVEQWSGTSDGGTVLRTRVDTAGDFNFVNGTDIVYTQTAINIAANNTPYVIATRSQTTFTSAKFIVSAKRGTGATGNVETYEAQVVTDGGGSAWISTYGIVNNGYAMGVLSANVVAGNVNVYYTGTVAASVVQANVKAFGTFIV